MTQYEIMSGPDVSDRAPRGVCEIAVQITTDRAFEIQSKIDRLLEGHVNKSYETKAYDIDDGMGSQRLIIYTGGDRIPVSEIRDIAELYSGATGYEEGNIPPNVSIFPAKPDGNDESVYVWLEFELQAEMPKADVKEAIEERAGEVELTPKHPEGTEFRAIKFREKNYAYSQVRDVTRKSNIIQDELPLEYVQLVCEV